MNVAVKQAPTVSDSTNLQQYELPAPEVNLSREELSFQITATLNGQNIYLTATPAYNLPQALEVNSAGNLTKSGNEFRCDVQITYADQVVRFDQFPVEISRQVRLNRPDQTESPRKAASPKSLAA